MPRLKPIVASTPEELAAALGLSALEAKEWQVRCVVIKGLKEGVGRRKHNHSVEVQLCVTQAPERGGAHAKTHPRGDRKTGGHFAIQSDRHLKRRPRTRIYRSADSHPDRKSVV